MYVLHSQFPLRFKKRLSVSKIQLPLTRKKLMKLQPIDGEMMRKHHEDDDDEMMIILGARHRDGDNRIGRSYGGHLVFF